MKPILHEFFAKTLMGKTIQFSDYAGKVVLITNIALKCGTTPQLGALQELYEDYNEKGLIVLGFPSRDFAGKMEPTDPVEIGEMCKKDFGVSFPIFTPGHVRGQKSQPVFKFLTSTSHDDHQGEVHFNFEKFLIDKEGRVRHRFGPFTSAKSNKLRREIESLLEQ